MKVVILGGYGNFGARIARALAHDPAIELVVAGRDIRKARLLAEMLDARPATIDAGASDLANLLKKMDAGMVIHTAGPFQAQDYQVALSAAAAGCHYIDLADSRRFVCDFAARVDPAFQRVGKAGITGASTVPALSSAVVDALRTRFLRLESIDTCIAPAQQAPRGEATLAGVLSYCGAPVRVWKNGSWEVEAGWSAPEPIHFARMKPRLGALCDIPDLELFVQRYPGVNDVGFRAALEVTASQRIFAAIAWLHRRGMLRRPALLAPLFHRYGMMFDPFGTPVGGMVIRLAGRGLDDRFLRIAWHITAGEHHGPEIPCMAAILLARRIARGETVPPGAHACMGFVKLQDFQPEFERWHMNVDLKEELHGA